MLNLAAGDYRLVVDPCRGGSILRFDWRGEALMRPACGGSIFDVACFPLVPFSNRIAYGRFTESDREVRIRPNFPGSDHLHPLHGFGWLSPWATVAAKNHSAVIEHIYLGEEWPWRYRAEQTFELTNAGLQISLALTNLDHTPMPAGVGFHPYFPRNEGTRYTGLHRGEWRNDADCLPLSLTERAEPRDWWEGGPVAARYVDTVYTGRSGALSIQWPDRDLELDVSPSDNLPFTVVFTPASETFFCVEPVSHMSDAVNRNDAASGIVRLKHGATMTAYVRFVARRL
ncbi:MAG: aldose 1-epimerase [Novosphingobium sp.]